MAKIWKSQAQFQHPVQRPYHDSSSHGMKVAVRVCVPALDLFWKLKKPERKLGCIPCAVAGDEKDVGCTLNEGQLQQERGLARVKHSGDSC